MENIIDTGKKTVLIKSTKSLVEDMNKMTSKPKGEVLQTNPYENTEKALQIILEDEEIQGFYGHIIDKMVESSYAFKGSPTAVKKAKERLKKLKFDKHLKKWYFILITQKKAFIELVRNQAGGEIVGFYEQPTHRMAPTMDTHGRISKYVKTQVDGSEFDFMLDEIVLLSIEEFAYNFWDKPQISTLEKLVRFKNLIMDNIYTRFNLNLFKTHFHFQGLSKEDIEDMSEILKLSPNEREKFLFTIGELPLEPHKLDTEESMLPLLNILDMIRNKMLSLIRVPPIIAGTVDNSNRSNSDVQARFAFTSRINSLLKDTFDEINYELLPALGLTNVEIIPGTVDLKEDSEYISMAQQLIAMNCDRTKVEEWLKYKGVDLPDGIFTIPEDQKEQMEAKSNPLEKNSKLYPSRRPQNKSTADYETGSENHNDG